MKQTFYSNGKLLITGEYVVLDGAIALALPTKFGQNLVIENGSKQQIVWKSYDADGSVWFDDILLFSEIIAKTSFENNTVKTTLIEILHHAYLLNSNFITTSEGYIISTELTFPKFWGLGTSSTLINNIAQWLTIDAFQLLKNSFGGSGYDIACAQNDSAILYQLVNEKPIVRPIPFDPKFKDQIYFVYLNKKQSSKTAITNYYKKQGNTSKIIPVINEITNAVITNILSTEFVQNLEKHELEMSHILEMQTVKELLFPDFDGVVKSLGAWGGDFVMVVSKENPYTYFDKKGYEIVLPYSKIIL
ncbi:GYDIA family GHMP kinase [Flavobacterium sp.]|uniref:GYDIA family GHMP kinase n=1 Tax=Flavobacterium sp. TaxID=239 RepID=UPI00286D9A49|nr:GYDIA family GHMP kinase [Flavobacterium sp.]